MRIILHIGFHKAGSTYIQNFFRANYLRFKKQGIFFPKSGFEQGLRKYSAAGHNILSADRDDERLSQFLSEVLSAEEPVLVLSAENLSLEAEKSAGVLAGFLKDHEVTVVAYLRRQDKAMASMYKEQVTGGWGKFGGSLLDFFDSDLFSRELLDYKHVLDAYASHFGKDNIIVRPFERAQWKDGSLARDFVHVCSLPWIKGLRQPTLVKGNPSYPDAMVQLIRLLNRVELPEKFYREFIFRVSRDVRSGELGMGPDHLDPQKTGKSFWTALGEGNRRITSEYLPDSQSLFIEPDFSPIRLDSVSELSPYSSYLFGCFVESLTDWIASIDKTLTKQHSSTVERLSVLDDGYSKLVPALIDLKDWAGTSRNLLSDLENTTKDLSGESTELSSHLDRMENGLDEAIANTRKAFESKLEDIGGQLKQLGSKQKTAILDMETGLQQSKVSQAAQQKTLEALQDELQKTTGLANDINHSGQQATAELLQKINHLDHGIEQSRGLTEASVELVRTNFEESLENLQTDLQKTRGLVNDFDRSGKQATADLLEKFEYLEKGIEQSRELTEASVQTICTGFAKDFELFDSRFEKFREDTGSLLLEARNGYENKLAEKERQLQRDQSTSESRITKAFESRLEGLERVIARLDARQQSGLEGLEVQLGQSVALLEQYGETSDEISGKLEMTTGLLESLDQSARESMASLITKVSELDRQLQTEDGSLDEVYQELRIDLQKTVKSFKKLDGRLRSAQSEFAWDRDQLYRQIHKLQEELEQQSESMLKKQMEQGMGELKRTVRDDVSGLLAAAIDQQRNEINQKERRQLWDRWKNDRTQRVKGIRGKLLLRRETRFLRRSHNFDLAHFIKQDISPVSQEQDIIRYFAATGVLEGSSPEQGFNTIDYVCNNHASLKYGENPYIHYLMHNN